jgi:hypothetical protein
MVYRRTHQVVKRLAARRSAILADGGMAAVQIAPVAIRDVAEVTRRQCYHQGVFCTTKTQSGNDLETSRVRLRLSCKRRQCRPALGDGCIVGPDMAGRGKKTMLRYGLT